MLSSSITDEVELKSCKKVLHEFVNRLYGLCSVGQSVQAIVFGGRDFNSIPPSSDALHQKVMHAAYKAGHIWGNMFEKILLFHHHLPGDLCNRNLKTFPDLSGQQNQRYPEENNKELSTCGCQSEECQLSCTCCRNKQI